MKKYLQTTSRRSKWSNSIDQPLHVDDIDLVLKDQTPRGIWPLERVTKTTPELDAETRVVKVKTSYGTYIRPVSVLARVFLRSFFFRSVFRQCELPFFSQIEVLTILTTFQPKVTEPISKKMSKDFNQLLPPKTLEAPFLPLQHVVNVIATLKMIQINRQSCNKNFDSFFR